MGPTPVSPAKRKEPPSSDSDDKETPESQKSEGRKDRERAARYSYASPQAHAEGGTVRGTGDRKIVPGTIDVGSPDEKKSEAGGGAGSAPFQHAMPSASEPEPAEEEAPDKEEEKLPAEQGA